MGPAIKPGGSRRVASIPWKPWRRVCNRVLTFIAESWILFNNLNQMATGRTRWDVQGVDSLNRSDWYLVIANHQSWVDILVLQRIFHRKIPFLKFFLKQELIWFPLLGQAWWALDFPFIKRYKKYHAHDEKNECRVGDEVKIIETRPLSKLKRFRVTEIVKKAV